MIRDRWRSLGSRSGTALLLLVLFWLAAAGPAVSDAVHLLRVRVTTDRLGPVADAVVVATQEERRLSTGFLAGGSPSALRVGRDRTDQAVAALRDASRATVSRAATADGTSRANEMLSRLAGLGALRSAVDARRIDRIAVLDAYAKVVDVGVTGPPLALSRARELFAEQDALLSGTLGVPGGPTDGDRTRLAELIGGRRLLLAGEPVTAEPGYAAVQLLENRILLHPEQPATPAAWSAAAGPVRTGLRAAEVAAVRDRDRAGAGRIATIIYAGLLGGFGLIAVAGVVAATRRSARAPSPPATGRRTPPATGGRVQELLLDLHRRCQQLVHRQLRLLDAMERRETDDETLADLFRADHLANRLRRHVEKAIMLAGGTPGRRWRNPVPITDVVRGAAAATADYLRVSTAQVEPATLAGSAVTDVMHLLTELIDNATTYSPAETRVRVSGSRSDGGYLLTVTDAGTGMTDDDLLTAHQVLADPEPPPGGTWFGLYAAGRFADRQGLAVTLRGGPAGGVTAEVSVPAGLIGGTDHPDTMPTTELPVIDGEWDASADRLGDPAAATS